MKMAQAPIICARTNSGRLSATTQQLSGFNMSVVDSTVIESKPFLSVRFFRIELESVLVNICAEERRA